MTQRKFRFQLAWKNLSRYFRRTLITAAVMMVGMACFILLDSMLIGAQHESEANLQKFETGSAVLMTETYWEDMDELPVEGLIENPDFVIKQLNESGVYATARSHFFGDMTLFVEDLNSSGTYHVIFTSYDDKSDSNVFDLLKVERMEGEWPEESELAVVIGSWFAEDIGVNIGDIVTFSFQSRWGVPEAYDFTIKGIIDSSNPEVNRTGLYIRHDTMDDIWFLDGAVSGIYISYPETGFGMRSIKKSVNYIADKNSLNLYTWEEQVPEYMAVAAGDEYGSYVILLLVFIIASVGISNTMLMTVMERSKEIGMMRAMGMTESSVRSLFIIEAGFIGLLGSVTGALVGMACNWFVVEKGLDFTWMMRNFSFGYRFSGVIYGVWNWNSVIIASIAGTFIAIIIAHISLKKLLKHDIAVLLKQI